MFLVFICLNKTKKDKFEFPFAFSIFDPGVDHLKNSAYFIPQCFAKKYGKSPAVSKQY